MNKFTSALVGLGVISLAGVASAAPITVYITGSTAARANFYTACTTAGDIFATPSATVPAGNAAGVISPSPNNANSANTITFEGTLKSGPLAGQDVIINCSWTGSEAGISAVAGTTLKQTLFQAQNPNAAPGGTQYSLPGQPPLYLTPASGYATTGTIQSIEGAGSQVNPDFTMADTSQKVSQTPSPALTQYGIVGIVSFTPMKGYESSPDATYGRVTNVPQPALAAALIAGESLNAYYLTGNSADSVDGIGIIGRNLGSGTKVNTMLNAALLPVSQLVSQTSLNGTYPAGTPGTLTFSGVYGPAASVSDNPVGNDGYDSGSGVQKSLNCDGSGKGIVYLGYLGISDARHAFLNDNTGAGGTGSAANSGTAVYLQFNGVYESDTAIETGNYTWWGQENLYGQAGQVAPQTQIGDGILTGLTTQINTTVNPGGNVTTTAQNAIIPVPSMQVYRSQDYGNPLQGSWPTPYQFQH
ncbi:MAG TPA: hypothetical protein VMH87_19405 [Pseudomonadales bacterium]|nr:hypothetical protein [Pseudomonadales bacterium]